FRFNGRHVYLTDAGKPAAILVLDLDTGQVRRVLNDVKSVTQLRPLMAEGRPLVDPKGKPVVVNADQLEVSPDGRYFYYQSCTGPFYRIETRWLDDPATPADEVSRHAELYADTPSTGGTAIDAAGNIYSSDTDKLRIIKIAPDGTQSTFAQDPRLLWVDAMWIDDAGYLWIPAAQMNRTANFNGGVDAVERPTVVYKMKIDAAPVRR
ncbi:MAG: hypothetical protein INR70_17775, partial [Parafilimonas terrae]|nr:hypothetical protein [Parafilimonas terrae]